MERYLFLIAETMPGRRVLNGLRLISVHIVVLSHGAELFSPRYVTVQAVLISSVIGWIGCLSYSIYAWHEGVYSLLPAESLPLWQRAALDLIGTFIVASLSYYLIEQPFLALRRYFRSNRPSAAVNPAPIDIAVKCVRP